MVIIKIDNQVVNADPGATILDAAAAVGVNIPTLCHRPELRPETSCMVCVVEVAGRPGLVPACGAQVCEAMQVCTDTPRVRQARRAAVALLLREHVGECLAPCQLTCPALLDIPAMMRAVQAGDEAEAAAIAQRDLLLPVTLAHLCPAPCQRACRRGGYDRPLPIRAAHLSLGRRAVTPRARPSTPTGKKVAIVGAGPAGMAAAATLAAWGHRITLFERHDAPGATLTAAAGLPTVAADIAAEAADLLGAVDECRWGRPAPALAELRADYDAVILAVGATGGPDSAAVEHGDHGLRRDHESAQTNLPGVFAAGACVRLHRMAVRGLADGRAVAHAVHDFLTGRSPRLPARPFSTRVGAMTPEELAQLVALLPAPARAADTERDGCHELSPSALVVEARRCLHCDCRKLADCRLRTIAQSLGVPVSYTKTRRRDSIKIYADHPEVVLESGKCMRCGLCVQLTNNMPHPGAPGLALVGRGAGAAIAPALGADLAAALGDEAQSFVAVCPTGAIAFRR